MEYNFREIEKKWQKRWVEEKTYQVKEDETKQKYYVLNMFPYPSGAGGQSSLKLHFAFQSFVQGRYAGKCYAVSLFGSDDDILMRGGELSVESNPSRTVGG